MKTPIKIIILIVVIFAAVGGVMVYMKTRVAPPDPLKLETKNNFLADSVTKACTNTTDLKAMPKERIVALDMLALLNSESLLAENDANKRISAIENHYADLVGKFSSDVFRGSVWNQSDLDSIKALATSRLRAVDLSGAPALNNEMTDVMRSQLAILSDYNAAKAIASSTSFVSVADAQRKISDANRWKNHKVLANNHQLMSQLQAVPRNLSESHYASLERKLASLSNYSTISSPEEYTRLRYNPFVAALDEYERTQIYGEYKKSTGGLLSRANDLNNQAISALIERLYSNSYDDSYDYY